MLKKKYNAIYRIICSTDNETRSFIIWVNLFVKPVRIITLFFTNKLNKSSKIQKLKSTSDLT